MRMMCSVWLTRFPMYAKSRNSLNSAHSPHLIKIPSTQTLCANWVKIWIPEAMKLAVSLTLNWHCLSMSDCRLRYIQQQWLFRFLPMPKSPSLFWPVFLFSFCMHFRWRLLSHHIIMVCHYSFFRIFGASARALVRVCLIKYFGECWKNTVAVASVQPAGIQCLPHNFPIRRRPHSARLPLTTHRPTHNQTTNDNDKKCHYIVHANEIIE